MALLAWVLARGERPARLLAFSHWTDLSVSDRTLGSADGVFLAVGSTREEVEECLCRANPRDPRASPLFAAFPGAPPAMIQVGGREALTDDSEWMKSLLREAGGGFTFQVREACPHIWQVFDGWLPEARVTLAEAVGFVQTSLESARR